MLCHNGLLEKGVCRARIIGSPAAQVSQAQRRVGTWGGPWAGQRAGQLRLGPEEEQRLLLEEVLDALYHLDSTGSERL